MISAMKVVSANRPIGYSIGTAPVIGYHDGAQNHTELKGLLRKSLILIGVFGVLMVLAAEVLTTPLAKVFVGYDAELMELTVYGFLLWWQRSWL